MLIVSVILGLQKNGEVPYKNKFDEFKNFKNKTKIT